MRNAAEKGERRFVVCLHPSTVFPRFAKLLSPGKIKIVRSWPSLNSPCLSLSPFSSSSLVTESVFFFTWLADACLPTRIGVSVGDGVVVVGARGDPRLVEYVERGALGLGGGLCLS